MARGPAYPYINLGEAVRLSRQLYEFAKRAPANVNAVLKDKWGYSPTSSSSVKIIAAMKYFGLVEVAPGSSPDQETVRISDRAFRILVDTQESPERKKALRDACLAPKAYKLCWDAWGKDMPESMRSMLIFTHGFHEGTVDGFLVNYRKSVVFAGLLDASDDDKQSPERQSDGENTPNVGDFVQWEHNGMLSFPTPLKVVKFSDDKTYAWVEGHTTGLSLKELVKVDPPLAPAAPLDGGAQCGNVEPGSGTGRSAEIRTIPKKGIGMRQEVFSLAEGDVTIQWPERISKDSFQDFEDWLVILKRKIGRNVVDSGETRQGSATGPANEE